MTRDAERGLMGSRPLKGISLLVTHVLTLESPAGHSPTVGGATDPLNHPQALVKVPTWGWGVTH